MDFWHSLGGMVDAELTCADSAGLLTRLADAGITVYSTVSTNELVLNLQVQRRHWKKFKAIVNEQGGSVRVTGRKGLFWNLAALRGRPVLVFGLALLIALGAYLPSRIFFIQVEGNTSVPTRLILEQAAQCGIRFGASRREVRSEQMKNALLEAIPQLQWAGLNTSGCIATISVRERQITEKADQSNGVSSIVALRDGVISEYTVTRGNGVCKVGQAVKAGEVLISGYTDCGISIRATRAEGEVYARTERNLTVITPSQSLQRQSISRQSKKFSLIIGKKRINFYKGSGISDTSCDKMYKESYVTLPGGFQLPVVLVTEVWTYYDDEQTFATEEACVGQLSEFADSYLGSQMVAGRILTKNETVTSEDGFFCLEGEYACLEMIGQVRDEEIIAPYGKDD